MTAGQTVVRWALRDTMVRAFIDAFEGKDDAHPANPDLETGVHAAIALALIAADARQS